MNEQDGLGDPRQTYPEMGENAYAMHEPPDRMELLADLLKETRRIEKEASWLERTNANLGQRLREKEAKLEALTERVVKAERALVDAEQKDNAIPAAVYLEALDPTYIEHLRDENEEARSI